MPSTRKCILPGCENLQNSSVSLFKFPKNDDIKKRWINFVKRHIDGELRITTNTRLCSEHFTPDSFTNFHRRQLGFTDNPLLLVNGAEPTIFRPGLYLPVPPTSGATVGSTCPPMSQSLPTTRETKCQCDNMQKVTREVGCQTDHFEGERTVDTQLSKRTLSSGKNTGSQAMVAMRSVAVGNTTSKLPPLCSSTPLKRKAVSPDRPPKRPLLEFPSFQESVNGFNMADPDDSTCLPSMSELVDTTSERAPTKTPQDMVKYLVYEDCLLELFKICPTCSSVCKVVTFVKGTFLSVTQKCLHQSCSYTRQWKSQPLLGSSPAGNLHLSAAVYYTGSSFIQTNKVLNAMHVRTFTRMSHRNHVHNYILPSVLHKWRSHQTDLLEGLKQSETVSLGGDMRADSPGHCAKYGSYSMMDLSTNKIVDIQLIQSNEVGSSVCMEKEGLIQSLEFLERSGVKVASLVTDRHTQVQKFVREQKPDIAHFYDVWHLCEALTKKLDAISKKKDCNKIKMWQKSIKNHLYWSASSSSNGEETVAKWTSLLNHIQNVHVHKNPLFPQCLHPPSSDKNKWLKPATKASYKLEKVLMNKRVLGDVKKLSPRYQTSALEGFHSVILRFAPKNVAFSYLGMLCRLYLAALHFNENSSHTQVRTAAGELQFQIKFPKAKRGEHVVSMVKTKYTTEYVTELTDLLFNEVIHDPAPFVAKMKAVAVSGFLCSQCERPEKSDAIASHVSRLGGNSSNTW
ncbi:uncharacterized protein LOC127500556 isoform X3 [Ctenopharyngodon idella]|uniref:uncharacterized protein LOC127500556 isoform X3 n=1 Tax=Ctenopharyngodon idella TaxID=7959 RepID=UPI00223154AB|nr:uncharacterized protein LOC127500556 isoform X3 [Ctenopharyngodon idella]